MSTPRPRRATPADAGELAQLLHDFNTEFATPTPEVAVLAERLRTLLATDQTFALVAGDPMVALALVSLRPNVWCAGPVALLEELYVVPPLRGRGIGSAIIEELLAVGRAAGFELIEINVDEVDVDAQRFYRRHGFTDEEPGVGRASYFTQEL